MTRGEIWWAEFGVPYGSEIGFTRPVLIVEVGMKLVLGMG